MALLPPSKCSWKGMSNLQTPPFVLARPRQTETLLGRTGERGRKRQAVQANFAPGELSSSGSLLPSLDSLPEPLQALVSDTSLSNLEPHFGTRAVQNLAAAAADRLSAGVPALPPLPSALPQLPSGLPQLPSTFPQLPSALPQFPPLPANPLGDARGFVEMAAQRAADAAGAGLAPLRGVGEGLARAGDGLVQAGETALRTGEGAVRSATGAGFNAPPWDDLLGDLNRGGVQPHFGSRAAGAAAARVVDWASGLLAGLTPGDSSLAKLLSSTLEELKSLGLQLQQSIAQSEQAIVSLPPRAAAFMSQGGGFSAPVLAGGFPFWQGRAIHSYGESSH
eukprot:jgi/Botrbrau1/4877/Bobra.0032s0033.1